MLHGKVRDWTDPADTSVKNVEGHHLFPRAYLRDVLGYKDIKKINQVANFAPTDWDTNILISDRPPNDYWPELIGARKMGNAALAKQQRWHALPDDWTNLKYEDFLVARRNLMATVVRDGYHRLADPSYQPEIVLAVPTDDDEDLRVTLLDLLSAGLVKLDDLITPVQSDGSIIGVITKDGEILLNDETFDSPDHAARAVGEEIALGLDFWEVISDEGSASLRELAMRFEESKLAPEHRSANL